MLDYLAKILKVLNNDPNVSDLRKYCENLVWFDMILIFVRKWYSSVKRIAQGLKVEESIHTLQNTYSSEVVS